jgi:hypothetical protein
LLHFGYFLFSWALFLLKLSNFKIQNIFKSSQISILFLQLLNSLIFLFDCFIFLNNFLGIALAHFNQVFNLLLFTLNLSVNILVSFLQLLFNYIYLGIVLFNLLNLNLSVLFFLKQVPSSSFEILLLMIQVIIQMIFQIINILPNRFNILKDLFFLLLI